MLGPLLDRIEIINVPAYLPVEKINIAKNYLIPSFEAEYQFGKEFSQGETLQITDASLVEMINNYCGFEAGVRNLRKCIDRVFRKIVAKLERKKIQDAKKNGLDLSQENNKDAADVGIHLIDDVGKVKEYQINTKNLERFLDVAPTDDTYYNNINKELNKGCSNGLAYVDDGYGAVLKI